MSDLNVPADLTVTPDLKATAASLMVLAATNIGAMPNDEDGRRKYGYRLAQEAAALAAAWSRPIDGLTHFLAQQRASQEKAPAKGILRAVELVDVGTPKHGQRQSQKVKLTMESTANPSKYTKPGDIQEFLSDFTNAVGFGDFEARARAAIGSECLFHKYLEDTHGRGQGATATVVVAITPLNNGSNNPTTTPAPRQSHDTPRSQPPAPTAPSGDIDPDAWFRENGWRDKAEHDKTRKEVTGALTAADAEVTQRFTAWAADKKFELRQAWPAEQAMLMKAKIIAIMDEEEERQLVAAGGVPDYAPDEMPF